MSFLKAEWRKLAIANYAIDPEILKKWIPAQTELDLWNGTCYVSLVGFMFTNVKLLGIPVPFHRHFEEVNLRFYVKRKDGDSWKRGVVFIKELVPRRAITFIANSIYKEHYQTVKMSHRWKLDLNPIEIKYVWYSGKRENTLSVTANPTPVELIIGSEAEFITEHYWGYTKIDETRTTEYEVRHPKWKIYALSSYHVDVDFGLVYGSDFEFLNTRQPISVMLAEGSEISVEGKHPI